jgi:hypothetical protein
MAGSARVTERTGDGRRGEFLFVVHVAAPDGGFERSLDGADQSRRRGGDSRRWQSQRLAGREFCGWCPEGLEIAKSFRHRFGGQIVPVTVQSIPRRRDDVSQNSAAAESEMEKTSNNRV